MPEPAPPSQHRSAKAPRYAPAVPLAVLAVGAGAAGAAVGLAPSGARTWTLAVTVAAWVCVALVVLVSHRLVHRARSHGRRAGCREPVISGRSWRSMRRRRRTLSM